MHSTTLKSICEGLSQILDLDFPTGHCVVGTVACFSLLAYSNLSLTKWFMVKRTDQGKITYNKIPNFDIIYTMTAVLLRQVMQAI